MERQLNLLEEDKMDCDLKYDPLEIEKLANDMRELKDTFEMVNTMVQEQGESINIIETDIDKTNELVVSSNIQLEKANQFQKSVMKKKGVLYGLGILAINIPLAPIVGLQFSIPISLAITGGGFLFSKKKEYKDKNSLYN